MKKNSIKMFVSGMAAMICLIGFAAPSIAESSSQKIAIFPFEVISREDQSFIGKGMGKMLCTRVGQGEKIQVKCLDKSFDSFDLSMGDGLMDAIARSDFLQGVEFLLMGSITIAGNAVSTDARLVDVTGEMETVNIHESGTGLGDVMRHAAGVAEKVRRVLVGGGLTVDNVPVPTISSVETVVLPAGADARTGHGDVSASTSLTNSIPVQEGSASLPLFVSRSLSGEISGLTIMDMGGTKEIAIIEAQQLTVLSWQNQNLVKKAIFKGKHYQTFVGVDAMDIDADGKDELFISILDRKYHLKSMVIKEKAGSLTVVGRDIPWFFRVVKIDGKKQLLGQKAGQDQLFWGEIYNLSFDGRRIVKGEVKMSGKGGIFGRSLGRLEVNGPLKMAWFDNDGFLNLGKETFEKEWISDGPWGSSALFVTYDRGKNDVDQRVYLNSRVAFEDVDANGHAEVIAVVNSDMARGFLSGFRKFTRGYVSILEWKGDTLVEQWHTPEVSGYVADFSLGDMNGDGHIEVVYGTVVNVGRIIGKPKSNIVVRSVGIIDK